MDLKFKAVILTSMIVLTGILGVTAYTASAYGYYDSEEVDDSSYSFMHRHRSHFDGPQWMDELTEEQREEIEQLIQDMKDSGATFEEIRTAVEAQLEEWGIEVPELQANGPRWLDELTEEQREEIEQIFQEMREQTQARITEKFQAWGIEAPEFEGCPQLMQFGHHAGW